jgi:DNA ligase (NAD+)
MVDKAQLVDQLQKYNEAYRDGRPLVDDATYDQLVEELRRIDPAHPFLTTVEPEKFSGRREVRHPEPMLSTEKAYTDDQLARFVGRVRKDAETLGISPVLFRMTPKLDGLAGRDEDGVLASRGNGLTGFDITHVFARGVVAVGGRGQGLGEIVIVKTYFEDYLQDKFEHPRNMVVGIVASDTLNEDASRALRDEVVRFVPYSQLTSWQGEADELLKNLEPISERLMAETDYPLDGVVVEVVDERLKRQMGATVHHYRWQIAVKRKGETARTTIETIHWQVGRTGTVTPVLEVAPVSLSGATIRRVTAHHAGMILKLNIGPGAVIEVIRSGEVIPKLERVIQPAAGVALPETCPACGEGLTLQNDFLSCANLLCPAQTERRLRHWFNVLGNADWYGIKTIQKLVAGGYDTLEKIYAMRVADFTALGFGPVLSVNLYDALAASRAKPVEEWRFLAAFGIAHLGIGDSRKLLEQIPLTQLFEDLSSSEGQSRKIQQLLAIKGFGDIKSQGVVRGLAAIEPTFTHMLALGFELIPTPRAVAPVGALSAVAGKHIVFTGKMIHGSREEMQERARQLGAIVQTAVAANTDYLVCGEKVGQTKLTKAAALGVQILSEADYFKMIGDAAA